MKKPDFRSENISVVLVSPKYQGNIGAVARSMKNAGLENLFLVNSEIEDEAIARSMGGRDILLNAKKFNSLEEAIRGFNVVAGTSSTVTENLKHFRRIPVTPEEFWDKMSNTDAKIALVFGREDDGLRNEELNLCNYFINIPGNPEYPVYNLSHAAAIILYIMFTRFNPVEPKRQDIILPDHLSILESEIGKTLDYIKYPAHKKENTMVMLTRIIGRSMLTETEYFKLMGIIRRVRSTERHDYESDGDSTVR